ncbi:MAG TPA: cation-transporting P-type ATPase [Steroidobacteraceae bacterium]|nr:cation-transporting P-type ATPase [Steroidobacteraceae bacterium]
MTSVDSSIDGPVPEGPAFVTDAPGRFGRRLDAWHASDVDDVLVALESSTDGLAASEAARRKALCGQNRLPQAARRGPLMRFLLQFHNLLIYVLLAAAVMSAGLGHGIDAVVIMGVVLLNAVIGFIQEGRAEQALAAIRSMIDPRAAVLRDGRRTTVAAEDIVPGDLVILEAGDRVPADLRLIKLRNLRIEEAVLTGESVAVDKAIAPVAAAATLGDRASMAFSGTLVAGGQGVGVAIGTGAATELGRIGAMLGEVEKLETPLLRQMDRFARQLTIVIVLISAAVFALAVLVRGYGADEAFIVVVGLAVAAIPEGLPAILTITLAIGVSRMARRNAIVRRLPAVETLGSVSVICSDKTGTLTRNEMTVRAIVTAGGALEVTGVGYEPHGGFRRDGCDVEFVSQPGLLELARAALLCNDASLRQMDGTWTVDGDPMEGALVSLAVKAGYDAELTRREFPRKDEIPFDAAHRFMATLHHSHEDGAFVLVKGAPERVLAMCSTQRVAGGEAPLDSNGWHAAVNRLAQDGQRVLAFATRPMPAGQQYLSFADLENGATLVGLTGFIDPPRDEAIEAVRDCATAGIRVVMITGDHALTAHAIGRQLGLGDDPRVASGSELDALDEDGLRALAREVAVFARTTPEHKLHLVQALQAEGAVVAMTGDGVNDAPALKRADVGVAMGQKGTEAAKEAAEMVLADDNFASIVAAVREGRTVYDNVIKVIGWTLPTNGGEAMALIAAIAFGVALPITPIQILWVNMVTAVTLGIALAFEPTEPGTMLRKPRAPGQSLISRYLLWRIVFVSLLVVCGVFGMFFWTQQRGLSLEEARTVAVNTIVVMEIFYLFSIRYVHGTSLSWRAALGTPAVVTGVATVLLAQLLFTYWPAMNTVFKSRPVGLLDGIAIIAIGVVLLVILEAEQRIVGRLGSAIRVRRAAQR